MVRYFCDYCDVYMLHSSVLGRRQHNVGRKHINNKIEYYQGLIREKGLSPPVYPTPAFVQKGLAKMKLENADKDKPAPPAGMPAMRPAVTPGKMMGMLPNMPGVKMPGMPMPGMPGMPMPGMNPLGPKISFVPSTSA